MRGVADYAVIYDISSDRERTRVAGVLKDFGFRIQKSVFECRMKKKDRDELIKKLESLDLKTGFVKIYKLDYTSKDRLIGIKEKPDIDGGSAFIV